MLCTKKMGLVASFAISLFTFSAAAFADSDQKVITGAGAHFSWAIFDELKPDLEKALGREIKLIGRESMLGAGCNAGIKTAKQHSPGNETFGFVCCPLDKQEISENHLKVYPLALEPILILVNRKSSVDNLTLEQARDIFSGKVVNWKEVGGDDRPVVLVTRLHCANRPGHWKTILDHKDKFSSKRLNVQSAADMVNRLNDFESAIGHTGAVWQFKGTDNIKAVSINGYAPTATNIRNGHYPFYRMLSAVTSETAGGDVQKLMELTQSMLRSHEVARRYSILPYREEDAALFETSGDIR